MNEPFPTKLNSIPIISAVVEIKFISNVPSDAVFGTFYPLLNSDFPELKKLPILQVPSDIREKDPQLANAPHYEFYNNKNDTLKVLLGPGVLAIVFNKSTIEYPGWTEYIEDKIHKIYNDVFQTNIITSIKRFGIRYTDFFNDNIFENTEFSIKQESYNISENEKVQIIRTFEKENFMHNVVVSNNAEVVTNGIQSLGSIIDIDSYIDNPKEDFKDEYKTYLKNGHDINKKQFFTILKKEYIDTTCQASY